MPKPLTSRKTALFLTFAFFLVGIIIVAVTKQWWPAIMLVIGLPLALRQYLLGRHYDAIISLFVFIGVFVTVQFRIAWQVLLPVLFIIGGIYLFFREFLDLLAAKKK